MKSIVIFKGLPGSEFTFWFESFQHEEVQFLEHELENQKQRYQELASFTKSLLSAVRSNDLERQQVCLHSNIFSWKISKFRKCVTWSPLMYLCLGTHRQSTSAFRPGLGHDCGGRKSAWYCVRRWILQPRRVPGSWFERRWPHTRAGKWQPPTGHYKRRRFDNWSYWALCIRGATAGSSPRARVTISCTSTHTYTHTDTVSTLHTKAGLYGLTLSLINSCSTPSACGLMLHYDCWADNAFFIAYHSPCSGPVQREQ